MSHDPAMRSLREQWGVLYLYMQRLRSDIEHRYRHDQRQRNQKLTEWEQAFRAADYLRDAAKCETIVQQRLLPEQPEQWKEYA